MNGRWHRTCPCAALSFLYGWFCARGHRCLCETLATLDRSFNRGFVGLRAPWSEGREPLQVASLVDSHAHACDPTLAPFAFGPRPETDGKKGQVERDQALQRGEGKGVSERASHTDSSSSNHGTFRRAVGFRPHALARSLPLFQLQRFSAALHCHEPAREWLPRRRGLVGRGLRFDTQLICCSPTLFEAWILVSV